LSQLKYINTIIISIILTTSIFTGFVLREFRSLQSYMGYIAENGKSALFHEEYINQNIAFRLSRAFSSAPSGNSATGKKYVNICNYAESLNGVYGLNLVSQTLPMLSGTLQTRNPSCASWARDVPSLSHVLGSAVGVVSKYSFSNYSGYVFNNTRYYIDLKDNYIYINKIIDTNYYTFNNWLVSDNGRIDIDLSAKTINIDGSALVDLRQGENIISHIYKDGYTHKNIISMITPVFQHEEIKGLFITDVNIDDLATSFYTAERPLLWRFLSLYVTDNATGDKITFHRPALKSFTPISYQENMTRYYTLHIKMDGIYLLISIFWLVVIYLVGTWVLCRYARKQLDRHLSLSRDNITDALTGLYNRKVLTSLLEQKIQELLCNNIAVTVISIDSDGLKKINDTLGHHMGDRAIQSLGKALAQSIRKSDYGIRLGGDEFSLILIDYSLTKSHEVIKRIQAYLQSIDEDKIVAFSYGSYQMTAGDTLETALLKADKLLYQHKRNKYGEKASSR
jgi:diguanylate cyclase (GGDEF)-like protein